MRMNFILDKFLKERKDRMSRSEEAKNFAVVRDYDEEYRETGLLKEEPFVVKVNFSSPLGAVSMRIYVKKSDKIADVVPKLLEHLEVVYDMTWSIRAHYKKYVRTIEDFECFDPDGERSYVLETDFKKYEMFMQPEAVFFRDLAYFPGCKKSLNLPSSSSSFQKQYEDELKNYILGEKRARGRSCKNVDEEENISPNRHHNHLLQLWQILRIRESSSSEDDSDEWRESGEGVEEDKENYKLVKLWLRESVIFFQEEEEEEDYTKSPRYSNEMCYNDLHPTRETIEAENLADYKILARLSDFEIMTLSYPENATTIVLKPEKHIEYKAGTLTTKLINFKTMRSFDCWLSSLRLSKFGDKLRDAFSSAGECADGRRRLSRRRRSSILKDSASPKFLTTWSKRRRERNSNSVSSTYSSTSVGTACSNISDEDLTSKDVFISDRAPMDFSGGTGVIICDPKEAKAAAEIAESVFWLQRSFNPPRPNSKNPSEVKEIIQWHLSQSWYKSHITRELAISLLKKQSDGTFLVRPSSLQEDAFVLSVTFKKTVHHFPILPRVMNGKTVFTMDSGQTHFFDIIQLVDFHRLNRGILLPCLLANIIDDSICDDRALKNGRLAGTGGKSL